jgi:hypothetical protein
MACGERKQAGSKSASGSRKKAEQTFELWAARNECHRDLLDKISDGTVDKLHAAGNSHPNVSQKLHPDHNPASFSATVKKARSSTGVLVGKHLSFLFCFALIVISLVF